MQENELIEAKRELAKLYLKTKIKKIGEVIHFQ